jgi:hypothetical protein
MLVNSDAREWHHCYRNSYISDHTEATRPFSVMAGLPATGAQQKVIEPVCDRLAVATSLLNFVGNNVVKKQHSIALRAQGFFVFA